MGCMKDQNNFSHCHRILLSYKHIQRVRLYDEKILHSTYFHFLYKEEFWYIHTPLVENQNPHDSEKSDHIFFAFSQRKFIAPCERIIFLQRKYIAYKRTIFLSLSFGILPRGHKCTS